jgi:hypothetical protein
LSLRIEVVLCRAFVPRASGTYLKEARLVELASTYYSRNFFAWDLGRSQNYRGGGPISEVPKNSIKMGLGRSTLNKLAKNNL